MVTHEQLRKVLFRPYRKGMGPTFRLVTWDTGRTGFGGKYLIGYRLTIHDRYTGPGCAPSCLAVLFEGEDFGCSPLHAIDSDAAVASLMAFLTLRPGDTDAEYFEDYTPAQLAYCSEHAEALSSAVESRFGEGR